MTTGANLTRLARLAAMLAWGVVALGAYVRLSDAGLGCPDWPGCYGQVAVPATETQRQAALSAFPERPLEAAKAWKEMIHRYAAGALGGLILALFAYAWRERGRKVAAALLWLVAFQALLGRWTVTELLHPAIVTAHLLGGMVTLALLVWLAFGRSRPVGNVGLRGWALAGLALVLAQIALGGWTSSHYAALVCGNGLSCRGEWLPEMDFIAGFSLAGAVSPEALTTIHWSHRLGAVAVAGVLAPLAVRLLREPGLGRFGALILGLLAIQIGLGVANVVLGLPLAAAVLHNAVAALLLVVLVALNRVLYGERSLP